MKGSLNTTGVEENKTTTNYPLLPDGVYEGWISDHNSGFTKANDPMVNITIKITFPQDFQGRLIWDRIVLPYPQSPARGILGRTKHFLHCISEPYEGEFEWDSDNWNGKKVIIKVGSRTYNGKTYNEVQGYILDEANNAQTSNNKSPDGDDIPF